jgi:hypothetical protein
MDDVARLSPEDKADLFQASATKRGLNVVVIEKDFWVCWVLKRLFTLSHPPAGLVFKGGTSLSKVYKAIERFSEDVDLSFDRSDLGFGGAADPANLEGRKKQDQQIDKLLAACTAMVRDELLPQLQDAFSQALGGSDGWRIEIDPDDKEQQTVLFHYPQSGLNSASTVAYLRPFIRLEMGARGEQWPSQQSQIRPYVAEDFPGTFKSADCTIKVCAAERTFWEKATILHMWYHAAPERHLSDRQSRHYYDVTRLYQLGIGDKALSDTGLLRSVAKHKAVFFNRNWAKFDEAVPGTLRLAPQQFRLRELESDYAKMQSEMIFGAAPSIAEIAAVLKEIEDRVNA